MARLDGFALLLLTMASFTSRCVLAQEATAQEPKTLLFNREQSKTTRRSPERIVKSSRHASRKSCIFPIFRSRATFRIVVNAIRVIPEVKRVQQIVGAQIIVIEGTMEQVAMAEKLAAEIDKDKRRFGALGYRIAKSRSRRAKRTCHRVSIL